MANVTNVPLKGKPIQAPPQEPVKIPQTASQPQTPHPVEHKVIRRETLIPESDLNILGMEGWELVTAVPVPHGLGEESLFFFKRRKT